MRDIIQWISIHALLAESDTYLDNKPTRHAISIHALLAESDFTSVVSSAGTMGISIHALLAESDSQHPARTTRTTYFYPRSPCGERQTGIDEIDTTGTFLSTLSLRRATTTTIITCTVSKFLSTLSLRRATAKVHKTVGHFFAHMKQIL